MISRIPFSISSTYTCTWHLNNLIKNLKLDLAVIPSIIHSQVSSGDEQKQTNDHTSDIHKRSAESSQPDAQVILASLSLYQMYAKCLCNLIYIIGLHEFFCLYICKCKIEPFRIYKEKNKSKPIINLNYLKSEIVQKEFQEDIYKNIGKIENTNWKNVAETLKNSAKK